MIDTLLEKKLKALEGKGLFTVMDDGLVFWGELQGFDKHTLVMTNVKQGSATDIEWKEIGEEEIDEEEPTLEDEDKKKYGYISWTKVNLEEVYIRIDHVTRLWPEKHEEIEEEERSGVRQQPVYYKEHSMPNISTSLDIPEDRMKNP